jgi:hypothetical protein
MGSVAEDEPAPADNHISVANTIRIPKVERATSVARAEIEPGICRFKPIATLRAERDDQRIDRVLARWALQ